MIALACSQCIVTLPCVIFITVENVKGTSPWRGLGDAHWHFSTIQQVTRAQFDRHTLIITQWNAWVNVFTAIAHFLFFGTSQAMWAGYGKSIGLVSRRLGIKWTPRLNQERTSRGRNATPPMTFHVRTTDQTSTTTR